MNIFVLLIHSTPNKLEFLQRRIERDLDESARKINITYYSIKYNKERNTNSILMREHIW